MCVIDDGNSTEVSAAHDEKAFSPKAVTGHPPKVVGTVNAPSGSGVIAAASALKIVDLPSLTK